MDLNDSIGFTVVFYLKWRSIAEKINAILQILIEIKKIFVRIYKSSEYYLVINFFISLIDSFEWRPKAVIKYIEKNC